MLDYEEDREEVGQNNMTLFPQNPNCLTPSQGGGESLSQGLHLYFKLSFSSLKTIHLMTTTYERMLSRDQCLKEDYACSSGQAEFRAPFGP